MQQVRGVFEKGGTYLALTGPDAVPNAEGRLPIVAVHVDDVRNIIRRADGMLIFRFHTGPDAFALPSEERFLREATGLTFPDAQQEPLPA